MRWRPERPFSLERWAARFTRWGNDPVHVMADGVYHRVLEGSVYRARQLPDGSFELDGAHPNTVMLADFRARTADSLPWEPVELMAARDRRVNALLARHAGFRPVITPDPFEAVVGLVAAQQVNLSWALETKSRLVRQFGTSHSIGGLEVWEFPSADRMAEVDPEQVRGLQFTRQKARSVVGLAQAAVSRALDIPPELGTEAAITRLTALRGVGRWTAEQLLARCWARPEVAAAGDLGVRKAVSFHWFKADSILSEVEVRDTTDSWGDAANLLSQLLLEEL